MRPGLKHPGRALFCTIRTIARGAILAYGFVACRFFSSAALARSSIPRM